ncbi:isochorismatase hydrolase [Methyloglobulus morosus KoM1]|uniref:Isochorismatase hydrolase n=1 Tax=Methyloglobulus morosus KoM1 TaxID=1116472 RepID=V5BRD7_9GAMM|nr:isochorismatase hydrolase [Methyloglobulus morosus]ESS70434.1 isochorismatase hydrolase [Methyloglobulus morosus KoM1]
MKNLFTIENSALLLIDHQVGTMSWVRSLELDVIKTNTLVLAKSAQATGMPVLLTSSMETQAQGLLFAELQQVVPDAYKDRIQREGQVDCMTDQNFSAAVEAMQRKNLIMAGHYCPKISSNKFNWLGICSSSALNSIFVTN